MKDQLSPPWRGRLHPLDVGDVLVYPNLGEPLRRTRDRAVGVMVTAVVTPGPAPVASLQVISDGQAL